MPEYKILILEPAEARLRKFDREIQKRFAVRIRKLTDNPDIHGKPLRGALHGLWELYFERSFRILYSIDYENRTVIIKEL